MNNDQWTHQTKDQLEELICSRWNEVNSYIQSELDKRTAPFYSSVDIRESKTKYAPVDLNFYPAGFNNLCQLDLDASGKSFDKAILGLNAKTKTIGLIVESHTKNLFYLDHLAYLSQTLKHLSYDVYLCSLDQSLFGDSDKVLLESHSKFSLEIHLLKREGNTLSYPGLNFDLFIMNNDQSSPIDIDWTTLETPIAPTPKAGWFRRKKTEHFRHYRDVVLKFSEQFSIDPNLLMANFVAKDDVDFMSKEGLEELGLEVDKMLQKLPEGTRAFVKADQGTYGMGISVVNSGSDISAMNRKARNKMDIGKNKIKFTSVIVQEGVDSILSYDEMPAEITIYLVAGSPIGGFVRANSQKGSGDNLNSKGMVFKKYCISEIKQNTDHQRKEAVYAVIARLSTLAGAYEIENILEEN